jgi:hypothetical protein
MTPGPEPVDRGIIVRAGVAITLCGRHGIDLRLVRDRLLHEPPLRGAEIAVAGPPQLSKRSVLAN